MICPPCSLAGFYNYLANDPAEPDDDRAVYRGVAEGQHDFCRDVNCPCQHVVGVVLAADAKEVNPEW